jgi:nucleotide-binding universal stress UspA family protein
MQWDLPNYQIFSKKYLVDKAKQLKKISEHLGVKSKLRYHMGDARSDLLSLSSKNKTYGMIALATHARKGLGRIFLGSVAEEVIRHSRIPVLVCGPKTKSFDEKALSSKKLKILVATDLLNSSLRAENYSQVLAKNFGAEIVLVYCLYEGFHPVLQTAFSVPNRSKEIEQFYNQEVKFAEKRLDAKKRKLEKLGFKVTAKIDRTNLAASTAILSEIEKSSPDFVVLGTHGRNLFIGALLGSSARRVVLESPIPVITVR